MFSQDLSYDPRDPMVAVGTTGLHVGLQIFTTANVYGLPAAALDVVEEADAVVVTADELRWAAQQQTCAGTARLAVARNEGGIAMTAAVTHDEPIKALKFVVRGLPAGAIDAGFWQATSRPGATRKAKPLDPLLWRYPWPADDPWPEWETPWAAAGPAPDGTTIVLSVRDRRVRPVRLYAHCPPWADGETVVEVICEGDAREWGSSVVSPTVLVRQCSSEAEALADLEAHLAHSQEVHAIPSWDDRTDVPDWFDDIGLVVTLHGMHWTGYAFQTFAQMIESIDFVGERIDGARVLLYLPGWEGRYYHSYPNYEPAPALGGSDGFHSLVAHAHERGMRVMPMFGMHGVNVANYEDWPAATFRTRTDRMPALVNKPDWDGDRAGEDDQVFCNPGEPRFRAHLLAELDRTIASFEVDGVFLDTSACWFNDPRFNLIDGYRALVTELRGRHPSILVAGEGWFDALLALFPVNQTWHDPTATFRCPDVVARYGRVLPHLSSSAFGWGSTGVHESGWGQPPVLDPVLAPGAIPNVSFVDTTLRDHASDVDLFVRAVAKRVT